jgi:hypothetical protein
MSVFPKAIACGAIVGTVFGFILAVAEFFRGNSGAGGGHDEHGYATIALVLICAVLGALCGVAAGVGAYLKKKFEGGPE